VECKSDTNNFFIEFSRRVTINSYIITTITTTTTTTTTTATGTISKSFRKYLSNVPGKHETKKLQKTAILGTANIILKVLM
jgi:uncharacterized protein YbcV (DUF1398 family)